VDHHAEELLLKVDDMMTMKESLVEWIFHHEIDDHHQMTVEI
jgi:hypothetical protein